jgi:hypothetical protein
VNISKISEGEISTLTRGEETGVCILMGRPRRWDVQSEEHLDAWLVGSHSILETSILPWIYSNEKDRSRKLMPSSSDEDTIAYRVYEGALVLVVLCRRTSIFSLYTFGLY